MLNPYYLPNHKNLKKLGFLVTPGFFPVRNARPVIFLIKVDLPTLDRPTSTISESLAGRPWNMSINLSPTVKNFRF